MSYQNYVGYLDYSGGYPDYRELPRLRALPGLQLTNIILVS